MRTTRRQSLRLIGGGVIFAATASATLRSAHAQTNPALTPWDRAGLPEEPRRRALSYAILAPNPHNRQPWLVDLREPGHVILHRDPTRSLPVTDPFSRQLTIGLGCFLELMAIAASDTGHRVAFDLVPEGETGPVAVARFETGATRDTLFDHALDRRSVKQPYADRPIPAEAKTALSAHAQVIDEPAMVASLKQLTIDAWDAEAATPEALQESIDLMRFGQAEIEANPDGIDLGGPYLESLIEAGVLTPATLADPTSAASAETVRIYHEMLTATPAYAVITTPGNSRAQQLEAGRRWLRFNLAATGLGIACHPVSQALQEYEEVAPFYLLAHQLLAEPGHQVQMLARLGYGPEAPRSPRWPLETRIIDG